MIHLLAHKIDIYHLCVSRTCHYGFCLYVILFHFRCCTLAASETICKGKTRLSQKRNKKSTITAKKKKKGLQEEFNGTHWTADIIQNQHSHTVNVFNYWRSKLRTCVKKPSMKIRYQLFFTLELSPMVSALGSQVCCSCGH